MKYFLIAGLAFLTVSCMAPGGGNLGVNIKLETHTLGNGLKIVLVEDHTVPIVEYQTWYRTGSVDEKPGITGISHLFEHLMFKGTPKYGPKQFFIQLEAKGADVNAFTTRDYTVYHETFVPSLLEKVVDMESDRMVNLKLDDETLNSERMVVFEERRLRTDNSPEGKMQEALWGLAYHFHPYRWPVIGYPQDLMAITTDQLVDYYKNHYAPSNATVVVVGDIKSDATYALLKKYYDGLSAAKVPSRAIPDEPEQKEERRMVQRDHVASERFDQAYHVTSAKDDDSYSLDVLANILFEGTSSRAYRKLVDEADVATGISGSAFTPTFPGLFIVSCSMKGGVPSAKAEKLLDEVIREVQEKGVTQEEISIAVKQLTVQLVDSARTPHGMAQLLGTATTIFGDPYRFAEDLGKYMKVTAADVKRVAQKYLIPNNRSEVVLEPDNSPPGKNAREKEVDEE